MTRILFVDDEPRILDGLRRMLRGKRGEWDMNFVDNGPEALELLEKDPFDIIVTDNRMPIMDGAQLLSEVKRLYPHMVRIILSGHPEQQSIMRSVRQAHQYLAKPCDAQTLTGVLNRACTLRQVLANESLAALISRIDALPALPRSYTELLEELESENSSLGKIGRMISDDIGMSATILKVVNSAFFGLSRRVTSPSQAVVLLGLDIVKSLVLSHHLFTTFDSSRLPGFSFEGLRRHCQATAGMARKIAQHETNDKTLVDEAYVSGLLHDVGKLVIGSVETDNYKQVLQIVKTENRLVVEAEKEVLGTTHAEVGAYLIGLWGLSDGIVEALAFHHRPVRARAEGFRPLTAVHVADVLDHELCVINEHYTRPEVDAVYIAQNGWGPRLDRWRDLCAGLLAQGECDATV